MKKSFFSLLMFVCVSIVFLYTDTYAQNKKLDPYSITTNAALYPQRIRLLDWIPETNDIAFSKDMSTLYRTSYPSKKTETIVTANELSKLLAPFVAEFDRSLGNMARLPFPQWKDQNIFLFQHANMYFAYDVSKKNLEKLNSWTDEAESLDFCTENNIMAYTKGNNLFIAVEGKEIAVTNETEPGIKMCNYVHREEFGIKKGTFWSPKGNYLAFYRMDESEVTDYPLVDVTARVAEYVPEKYPMAGMTSHYVTLGVYDINSGKTVFMKTGEPKEQYLTSVTWSPDEKYVFIGLLNRGQNHLKLNMYDALSGDFVRTLFEEKSDKYVEPLHPLYFIPGSNDRFLWMSQRDGFMHLYLYNTSGKQIKQVTSGSWVVSEILGFDEKGQFVYIHGNRESPIEQHVYKINLKNYNIQKITTDAGTHYGSINTSGNYCIDQYSSLEIASRIDIIETNGKKTETLLDNPNHLQSYAMPSTEVFSIQNRDGVELYCRMIKPADFDATKKYPVIVYVYGGPHAQLVTNSWLGGAGLFLNYLAQEGFIVFTLDNRGSANRGFEFETALHLNMGSVEIEDQMEGIRYLKALPYVDSARIGVHGWSYGGFMTIGMMLNEPDIFKVGVAGGPVTDWKYYEILYGERYMGTPENNPTGYEHSSLLNKADKLEGRLLIIHGAVDPVVVWQHSMMFLEKSIEGRKQVDYFVYPTEEHNVGWGNRGHLHEKIAQYFKDFL